MTYNLGRKLKWDKYHCSCEGNYFFWMMVYFVDVHGGRLRDNVVDCKTFMKTSLYKIAMKEMLLDNMKCMVEVMMSAVV
jgi:hypothetical protein